MESIQRDMAGLRVGGYEKSQALCFTDIVGADIDGTFKDSLTYQQTASVAEVSIAGQKVSSGNLQLAFRDEGVLLDINKTCLQFKVSYNTTANRGSNSIPYNCLYLFRPTSAQLGGMTWNYADGEHYIQQRLLLTKPDQIAARRIGLHLPLGPESYVASDYSRTDRNPLIAGLNARKQSQIQIMSVNNDSTQVLFNCSVPIALLFPQLKDTFPDGKIYLGNGQNLVLNLMLVDVANIRGATGAAATYEISQAQMLKVYTKLDGNLVAQIQKQRLPIRKLNTTFYVQPLTNSVVFNINLSKQERLRYLYLAISPQLFQAFAGDGAGDITVDAVDASYVATTCAVQGRSIYANQIMKSCTLVQCNFGGHTFTINGQIMSSVLESMSEDYLFSQDHPFMGLLFYPFRLDLSRFGISDEIFADSYGSSSGNSMSAQITFQFATGQNIALSKVTNAFTFNGSNYIVRLYSDSSTESSCENGIYRNIA